MRRAATRLACKGAACAIFILLMLGGALQDSWPKLLAHFDGKAPPQLASPFAAAAATATTATTTTAASTTNTSAKTSASAQIQLVDLIYYSLLALLATLLVFAVALASHLRRQEAQDCLAEESDAGDEALALGNCAAEKAPAAKCSCNAAPKLPYERPNKPSQHAAAAQLYDCAPPSWPTNFEKTNSTCLPSAQQTGSQTNAHNMRQSIEMLTAAAASSNTRHHCAAARSRRLQFPRQHDLLQTTYDVQVPFQRRQQQQQLSLTLGRPAAPPPPPPLVHKGLYYASRQSLGGNEQLGGGAGGCYSPTSRRSLENLVFAEQRKAAPSSAASRQKEADELRTVRPAAFNRTFSPAELRNSAAESPHQLNSIEQTLLKSRGARHGDEPLLASSHSNGRRHSRNGIADRRRAAAAAVNYFGCPSPVVSSQLRCTCNLTDAFYCNGDGYADGDDDEFDHNNYGQFVAMPQTNFSHLSSVYAIKPQTNTYHKSTSRQATATNPGEFSYSSATGRRSFVPKD